MKLPGDRRRERGSTWRHADACGRAYGLGRTEQARRQRRRPVIGAEPGEGFEGCRSPFAKSAGRPVLARILAVLCGLGALVIERWQEVRL